MAEALASLASMARPFPGQDSYVFERVELSSHVDNNELALL
jgi:hypothetical protein